MIGAEDEAKLECMAASEHTVHRGRRPREEITENARIVASLNLREAHGGDAENPVRLDCGEQFGGRDGLATRGASLFVSIDQRVGAGAVKCLLIRAPSPARSSLCNEGSIKENNFHSSSTEPAITATPDAEPSATISIAARGTRVPSATG